MISVTCKLARPKFSLDVDFEAGAGVLALFGPSGSGKSTILDLIAGVVRPDEGRIVLDGETMVDTAKGVMTPPHKRRIGFVFQSGQLFPHLTVRGNLQYPRSFVPPHVTPLVTFDDAVELLGIGHLLGERPVTLSGGEAQRVAIGRALLSSPRALLMDEPLASLDEDRKSELLPFIERLARDIALPIVYVSHSADEVARLATTVCRLSNGRIERLGPPDEVLKPGSLVHGERLGGLSILSGNIVRHDHAHAITVVSHAAGEISVPGIAGQIGNTVQLIVRPINVALALEEPRGLSIRTALRGTVATLEVGTGPYALAIVRLEGGSTLSAYLTRLAAEDLALAPGRPVVCLVKSVTIDSQHS